MNHIGITVFCYFEKIFEHKEENKMHILLIQMNALKFLEALD